MMIALTFLLILAGQQPGTSLEARIPDLETRLEALRPSDPDAYFELGEEIAEQIRTPDDGRLASQLFVLAFELSRGTGSEVAPGACLALASISRIESDRRWLRSLASSIDARYADPQWRRPELEGVSDDDAFALAMALGAIRSGDGIDARRILENENVLVLLREYEGLLDAVALNGAPRILQEQAEAWPCQECRNERIVKVHRSNPPEYTLCHTCGGNPGPGLTLAQTVSHLRLESELLNGIQHSWSAQVAADQGRPLRDPDPEELARYYNVDPSMVYWRDGSWVSDD